MRTTTVDTLLDEVSRLRRLLAQVCGVLDTLKDQPCKACQDLSVMGEVLQLHLDQQIKAS